MAEENKDSVENTENTQDQPVNETPKVEETATEAVEEVVAEATETVTETVEAKEEESHDDEPLDLTPPQEEFNWDTYEKGQDEYSPEERSRLGDVYNDTLNLIQEKEVVDGTIVSVGKKEVVVNIT